MNPIVPGPFLDIANLHDALLFLLPPKSDFIRPAGDYDTPAKLEKLASTIKVETVLQLGARTLDAIDLFKL